MPQINIQKWSEWLGIETFDDPELIKMVEACGRFCMAVKYQQSPRWISMLGVTGVGKTHSANRMWNWAEPRFNWSKCQYIHSKIYWPAFISGLKSNQNYDMLSEMWSWPMLFLDDIGAERDTSGFAAEQLNTLLGQRVGKWTIITSNLMVGQIANIDPRMADRIIREPGNEFVQIKTKSYALRQKT